MSELFGSNGVVPSLKDVGREDKRREQLHISGVNMLNECGQRFMFRYILGIRRPPNAFLHKGISLDTSVTKDLDAKIETGELLSVDDCKDIAAEKFNKLQKEEPIELDADEKREGRSLASVVGEAKDDAVKMAACHREECAPLLRPHRTARKFSINLDKFLRQRARDLRAEMEQAQSKYAAKVLDNIATSLNAAARDGIDFVGEQDIVERFEATDDVTVMEPGHREVLIVRDTKSSGKSPVATIADDSEQLTAYATASNVIDGALPDALFLDFVVLTPKKKETKIVTLKTTRSLDDVNVFLNRVVNAIHAIRSGIFVPTKPDDWRCSEKWCGYFDICPYAKRPKLVTITTDTKKDSQ